MNKKEYKLKLFVSSLLIIISLLVIILLIVLPEERQESSPLTEDTAAVKPVTEENINKTSEKIITDKQKSTVITDNRIEKKKKLYFIIDDAGYNIDKLTPFLNFPGSLTIAVLPGLPHSEESARLINSSGKQVFLHQPMEAVGKNNPGPGAIMLGMDKNEIRMTLKKNIESTPFIKGLNNHMGSAITSNPEMMEAILKTASDNKLIFTDSLTTGSSSCKEVAEKLGITIAQRDIFLDNVDNREAIMESINSGLNIAENKGYAVMIGHVWSSELANTMMEIYPNLIEEGFTLEEMSELLLGDM